MAVASDLKKRLKNTYREVEFDSVYRSLKGPRELVLPQGLEHHLGQVLQLVGLALGPRRVGRLGGRRVDAGGVQALGAGAGGLPLASARTCARAAAASGARHLRCFHAVPHASEVWRGHRGGGRAGGTPVV